MIRSVFSFKGTLDRKGFALACGGAFLAMIVSGVALFLLIAGPLAFAAMEGFLAKPLASALVQLAESVAVLAVGLPYVWVVYALSARRARAIGLDPWLLLASWPLVSVLDHYLLRQMISARFVWPLAGFTPIGGVWHAATLAILFMAPTRGAPTALASAPRPRPPSTYAGPPRATFGQRS
ncbi:MAG: hypothetical protein J0I28_07990 [Caulobacterales bacterium]|nr:hypothetical protein [Caulobacterales bacterium]